MTTPVVDWPARPVSAVLVQQVTKALTPFLRRVVRPIALRKYPSDIIKDWEFGSAQVISVADHYILLTAAHNIRSTQYVRVGLTDHPDSVFVEEDVYWLDDARTLAVAVGARIKHQAADGEAQVDVDVAAIELTQEEVERFGFEPIGAEAFAPGPIKADTFAIVCGYPTAMYNTSEIGKGRVRARYMSLMTTGIDREEWMAEWSQSTHQVVRYPDREIARFRNDMMMSDVLPAPGGISGCTFWTPIIRPDEVFSSKVAAFCGIEHTHCPARRLIVGNNADAVVNLIGSIWPATRGVFEACGFAVQQGEFKEQK